MSAFVTFLVNKGLFMCVIYYVKYVIFMQQMAFSRQVLPRPTGELLETLLLD